MEKKELPLLFSNLSEVGRVREKNEDSFAYSRVGERRLFVLADGMGGEAGGKTASETAVNAVQAVFEREPFVEACGLLLTAVREANAACLETKTASPELAGMGTTLDVLLIENATARWAHVGDSRIYLIREGEANQLTKDHTRIQQMVDSGLITAEDALEHPQRHILSRVVGQKTDLEPELSDVALELRNGDALLMCSDGLSDTVKSREIGWYVNRCGPRRACEKLVALANERGGHDNITVQIAHLGEARRFWEKVKTLAMPPPTVGARKGRRRLVVLGGAAVAASAVAVGLVGLWHRAPKSTGGAPSAATGTPSTAKDAAGRPCKGATEGGTMDKGMTQTSQEPKGDLKAPGTQEAAPATPPPSPSETPVAKSRQGHPGHPKKGTPAKPRTRL